MKLLIAADPHVEGENNLDFLTSFYKFASDKKPDCIALLGDLVGQSQETAGFSQYLSSLFSMIFKHNEKALPVIYEQELKEHGDKLRKALSGPYEFIKQTHNVANYLTYLGSKYSLGLSEEEFQKLHHAAVMYTYNLETLLENLKESYKPVEQAVNSCETTTYVLPGNHDIRLYLTKLDSKNIHLASKLVNGLKLSGYGGAAMRDGTPVFSGLPPELTTPFNEYPVTSMNEDGTLETRLVSEPMEFLEKEQPDIALLHTPLYGLLDLPANLRDNNEMPEAQKHLGSPGIREYAMTGKTKIFFSGHVHSDMGVKSFEAKNGSIVVAMNPGCLGNTEVRGGHFAEVLIDDNTKEFQSATFYEILPGGLVSPSATYVKRGRIVEPIIVTGAMPSDEMADAWLMEERAKKIRFR